MNIREEMIKLCPELATRKLFVWTGDEPELKRAYFVNFYNLPTDLVSCGAEKENNRMMFRLRRLPSGKFQLEHSVNASARQYQLRGKTASLEKIVQYLALFLQKVVAEVPPKYTHTKMSPSDNG